MTSNLDFNEWSDAFARNRMPGGTTLDRLRLRLRLRQRLPHHARWRQLPYAQANTPSSRPDTVCGRDPKNATLSPLESAFTSLHTGAITAIISGVMALICDSLKLFSH
nr:hypothetical protein [Paraburkholderia susongensis]